MTGAYLRVKRNGKFENVEIEYLTDEERLELFDVQDDMIRWINFLCNFIKDNSYKDLGDEREEEW